MLRNRIVFCLASIVLSLSFVSVSDAEDVTFAFTATVDRTSSTGALPELVDVGDEVTGTFSFESTSPDLRPTRSDSGLYNAIVAVSVDLNGTIVSGDVGKVSVFLSNSSLPDNYAVVANLDGGLRLEFQLGAAAGTGLLTTAAIDAPDLAGVFSARIQDHTGAGGIFGQVTSLTLVHHSASGD